MLNFRRSLSFRFPFVSLVAKAFFSGMARRGHARRISASPEVLEVRQVLSAATLSATLVDGQLTISDTSVADTNNWLTTALVGGDLVISDANEQFIAAPAGGTLSNGGKTLTIPASLVTSGLTINAGGGDDSVDFQAIDGAFSANLVVDGGSGNDTVRSLGAVNVGVGSVHVTTESTIILSPLTAGGAVNFTGTGDDQGVSIFAPIIAGADSMFSADKMDINNTITVGSHKLTLIPGAANGPGDAIDIGSATGAAVDTLELSNAELNRITASQIVIGNADSGLITISAAIELVGDSDVQVVSGYSLLFASGSSWTTTNGDLSFSGGGTASGTGNFNGIELVNGRVSSSGTGSITLNGHGGDGADSNAGILARAGSVIESTGTGRISLTGIGGTGPGLHNHGVTVQDDGTAIKSTGTATITLNGTGGTGQEGLGVAFGYGALISSVDGDILIIGQGGDAQAGDQTRGIGVFSGTRILSSGLAKITLQGTGGTGAANSRGVEIADGGTEISSANGDIQITGQGGDNASGFGVWVRSGAVVESTGTAKITVDGTAGDSYDANGVYVSGNGSGTRISSVDGDITIIGHGGNFLASGANRGVLIADGSVVQSTGTAKITVNGTGGDSNNSSRGVEICDPGTQISSVIGDITITGQAGAGLYGFGIWFYGNAVLQSTGTAKITLDGTGGSNGSNNGGVFLGGYGPVGGTVTSVDGDINIIGRGGDTDAGSYSPGVGIFAGTVIESTGTAKISIQGTGGNSEFSRGVEIGETGTRITSANGDIQITGQGGNNGHGFGIWVRSGALIESTNTARITLDGTGGNSGSENRGIAFGWYGMDGATVTSVDGDISLIGHGGDAAAGSYNCGVGLFVGTVVSSTGTARIAIDGTGGAGTFGNRGVEISGSTRVSSAQGDITIAGKGGYGISTDRSFNVGVSLYDGAVVESTATEGIGAKISITGTGGAGNGSDVGVSMTSPALVSSTVGDISVTGSSDSVVGIFNRGVNLHGASIVSQGTAKITVDGTGGNGGAGNEIGVYLEGANSIIQSLDGDISVTGRGGTSDGNNNVGLLLESGGVIESSGNAKINVNGTGGQSADSNVGVWIHGVGAAIRSKNGDIEIAGDGGTGGDSNIGINIRDGGVVESTATAKVSMRGRGGNGTESNYGVIIYGAGSLVRSVDGTISVSGIGRGTTRFNAGVGLQAGGSIISTGSALVSVTGSAGKGTFDPGFGVGQVGVWILNSDSRISSKDGDIIIHGHGGGDLGSTGNHGIMLQSGVIEATGAGSVYLIAGEGTLDASFGIQMQSDTGNIGINTSEGTGDIRLFADSINIDFVSQPASISAGSHLVVIRPRQNNWGVNLGGADAGGRLGLLDGELDRITAGTLQIGDELTGSFSVIGHISRPVATNMVLVSGQGLEVSAGQLDTNGGTLRFEPGISPAPVSFSYMGIDVVASMTTLAGDMLTAINGLGQDGEYWQLSVWGSIDLNGVKLQLIGSYIPSLNDQFIIVNQPVLVMQGNFIPIIGTFDGLPEGTIFNFNGRSLQISYVGGDGNDVVLTAVNQAPVATDGTLSTTEDTPASDTFVVTDVDSPTLTYSVVTPPAHGAVTITNTATGAYTYTPDENYNGTDSFTFKANDGHVDSNVATISITIEAVNDAPQLDLNGGPVNFSAKAARKAGAPQIVPNITVVDPDHSGTSALGGGTLTISIDASVKTTKKGFKLHDTIGGISNASALGQTTGALVSNGKLVLTIQLNAGATTNDIQAFLRGITFSTKGRGLKLTPRVFQAQLTDASGAASNVLQQTLNVSK